MHAHARSPNHTDSNKNWPECQVRQGLNPQQLSLDWWIFSIIKLLYFSWVLVEHKLRTLALGASGLDGSQQAAADGFGGLTLCRKIIEIAVKMKRPPETGSVTCLRIDSEFVVATCWKCSINLHPSTFTWSMLAGQAGWKLLDTRFVGVVKSLFRQRAGFCGGCFPDVIREVRARMAFPWLNQMEWWTDHCSCTYPAKHPWFSKLRCKMHCAVVSEITASGWMLVDR